jgi:hypothetical protein
LEKEMTTAIKLSEAQVKALFEIHAKVAKSLITARKNTIQSLVKAGLVEEGEWAGEPSYRLTDQGFDAIGEPVVDREKVAQIQEIEELQSVVEHDSIEEALDHIDTQKWEHTKKAIAELSGGGEQGDTVIEDEAPFADGIERFQDCWADWEKELAGFGATLDWRSTQVWDGLTAEEIRADMDTAAPINREARRRGAKLTRKLVKALTRVG